MRICGEMFVCEDMTSCTDLAYGKLELANAHLLELWSGTETTQEPGVGLLDIEFTLYTPTLYDGSIHDGRQQIV